MNFKRTNDMTTGDPVRLILAFAIPLFIGNIFQQVYNVADTMIAGYNLGDSAIAAIGATSTVYSLIVSFASGLDSGYGIVVARMFGAKDLERLRRSVASMILLNLLVAVVLTIVSLAGIRPLMHLIKVPAAIFDDAFLYIFIILSGLVMTVGYNLCAGLLRAVGNSKTPLLFLIIACGLNLVFDVLFIMVLPLGVGGAALATVLAQGCSVALGGQYIWKHYRDILPERRHFRLDPDLTREMLTTGLSMGLMFSVYSIGSVVLQGAINGLGEQIITAHTAARRMVEMLMQPLGTIGTANATFVSQNWGARQFQRIRSTLYKVFGLELLWSVISILLAYSFGRVAIQLLIGTTDEAVLNYAVMNLRISIALYPPLGILLALRNAMQSMGCKVAPVLSSGIELGLKVFSALVIVPRFGYLGASWTEPATWVACATFLLVVFATRRNRLYPDKGSVQSVITRESNAYS